MSPELEKAIERARNHKMTPEEIFEQKVSFVYGQQMDSPNPLEKDQIRQMLIEHQGYPARTITKEQVEEAAKAIVAARYPRLSAGRIKECYEEWLPEALAAAKAFGLTVEG